MNKLLGAGLLSIALICPAVARADVGGSVPGPGNCDYPAVGTEGAAFGEYDSGCAMPTEINGAHWQSLYGGGMWQVSGGLNAGIGIISINFQVQSPAGVLRGIQYWACPDLTVSEQPNPVGAWNKFITPSKCKTTAPRPVLLHDPPEPPPGAPEPPPLPPTLLPPGPPPAPQTAAETNPTPGNPVQAQNLPGH
jgi:hypothetical protein